MFGFGEDPIYSRDWSQGEILPQVGGVSIRPAIITVPDCAEYAANLIARAGCTESASIIEVLLGVNRVIKATLEQWAEAHGIGKEVTEMYQIIILREDYNFQMTINALSYFGAKGFAMGNGIFDELENEIPEALIPAIREGKFNKKKSDPVVSRDWSQGEIVAQNPDVAKLIVPNYNDYVTNLIEKANHTGIASPIKVLTDVYKMINVRLNEVSKNIDFDEKIVATLVVQIINRKNGNFQMLIDALSYYDEEGVAVGNEVAYLLENRIPSEMVSWIHDGEYDEHNQAK